MSKVKKGHVVHGFVHVQNRKIINKRLGVFYNVQSNEKKNRINYLLHLISNLNDIPNIKHEKNISVVIEYLKNKGMLN